jgi:hypothetical protein
MSESAARLIEEKATLRLSVPRRGHVLSSVAEEFGEPIRLAVASVKASLQRNGYRSSERLTASVRVGPPSALLNRTTAELAAWHICTQWLLGIVFGHIPESASLADAAEWFGQGLPGSLFGESAKLDLRPNIDAMAALRSVADPAPLADLLPYILDPHGPGSRLSVMRDPATRVAREGKRSRGIFYTPADVADHMVGIALGSLARCHPVTVFDPACGTGVYLRAALTALIKAHPDAEPLTLAEQSLFGIDIDPWAVDATTYVLLHDVMSRGHLGDMPPVIAWHLLRLNFAAADALSLDPAETGPDFESAKHADRRHRQELRAGRMPAVQQAIDRPELTPINLLFPPMDKGPHVILGNPPYAALGDRTDLANLSARFETLQPVMRSPDLHPLFVEQMVRLSAPSSSGSLVLPLSVAFNSRPQYAALRAIIGRTHGTWRMSFFDREPHALFGEDVKTRNTIVSWSRTPNADRTRIMTGPLMKWRGNSRARLFASIRFTEVTAPIDEGIPKLSGVLQAAALTRLRATGGRFASIIGSLSASELSHTFDADRKTVFVGSTAYNFINVFRCPPARFKPPHSGSKNTVHALRCETLGNADIAYALLSSRIAFWLWHVVGDGFHLTRGFIEDLPIDLRLFDKGIVAELASLGSDLWQRLRDDPVISWNRGRTSIAFPAVRAIDLQHRIDHLIIRAAGLPDGFARELDSFVHSVVAADPRGSFDNSTQEDFH